MHKRNLIYKFTWINSLGLPVCLWRDVLLHNHFLFLCCGTGHREKHFRLELAPLGNPFDFYITVHPSVCPSVTGRSDPLTVSAMPILQPPINKPQRPILLRICFFFYFIFYLFFRKNLRLRICFFFYLFFWIKKLKIRNGQKNLRLRICFFFYLFFLDFFFEIFLPFS
jgi:hypothetical protein